MNILFSNSSLVDFWADWCVPCKMMAPILNEVSAELSDNKFVAKANIEQFQILAQKYNVRSIPTMIMFKNGKEIERYVGVKQKNYLIEQFGKF
jgi:thioredoxin 1